MEEDEVDEVGISGCDCFVEGEFILRHGEEERDLFASPGFVV